MENKVMVPMKVLEAFEHHEIECQNMNEDTFNFVLMAIPFSTVHGSAKVLQDFAKDNPTTYLQAIASGYYSRVNVQDEVADMIETWLNKPYVGNEKRDIQSFARMVIKYFEKQNG